MASSGRTTTAHHEAGHAVGAFVRQVPIVSATIEENRKYSGCVRLKRLPRTFKQHHSHGVVALCGDAAQRRYAPWSIRQHHATADYRDAVTLAIELVGSSQAVEALVRLWQIQARDLIEVRWTTVSALAGALLDQGTMSDQAVQAAILKANSPSLRSMSDQLVGSATG